MEPNDSIGKSITEFFSRLTKEPAEAFGGMLADRIRFWRVKQAVRLKEKLEVFIQQRGIDDKREVPLKLAVAVLDGATMEEDDELHTEWAKLLTNALDPSFEAEVRIAYTEILRSLNPLDARLLHEIYNAATVAEGALTETQVDLSKISREGDIGKREILLSADCLMRQRCIVQAPKMFQPGQNISHEGDEIKWVTPPPQQVGTYEHLVLLTQLGASFVRCCT